MEELVISFEKNGSVNAMHSDKFNLGFLGKKKVVRASDIKHDPETDTWGIHLNDGTGSFTLTNPVLQGFSEYEAARKFEVKWLNMCRLAGVDATSVKGITRAGVLRDSINSRNPVV